MNFLFFVSISGGYEHAAIEAHGGTLTEPQGRCLGGHLTFITVMPVIFIGNLSGDMYMKLTTIVGVHIHDDKLTP